MDFANAFDLIPRSPIRSGVVTKGNSRSTHRCLNRRSTKEKTS